MSDPAAVVYVVDDDPSVRKGLDRMLRFAGFRAETFASAEDFLAHDRTAISGCLLLDVEMPGRSGVELQRLLNEDRIPLPIIFITGHGDIPMSVTAMKAGAADFLPKPYDKAELLAAVRRAVESSVQGREGRDEVESIGRLAATLTAREREVLEFVVAGMLNKQIGHKLGVTEKTVKFHRGNVMRKMRAASLPDLVRRAEKIDIGRQNS